MQQTGNHIRLETTIFVNVPEIFMQQFWSIIKKVKDFKSYEFFLANNKCIVDAEVFRKILDIYPRVEGEEFIPVQDDDDTLTFLTDLGYKGPLYKHTNMFVDHMHQPWRTLAAILNKCLSGKIASNDKLRKSRIDILWGMFYRDNVDYPELIWEDFAFQIDHKKEKKSRYVDISEESEPEPAKKKTASRRVMKKKVTIFADDNIIPDPIIFVSAESVPEPAKKKTGSRSTKTTNESKKNSSRHQLLEAQSEGICLGYQGISMSPHSVSANSSEGTWLLKQWVPDKENVSTEEKVILEWGSEQESEYSEEDPNKGEDRDWIDSEEDDERKMINDDDKVRKTKEEKNQGVRSLQDPFLPPGKTLKVKAPYKGFSKFGKSASAKGNRLRTYCWMVVNGDAGESVVRDDDIQIYFETQTTKTPFYSCSSNLQASYSMTLGMDHSI
ncbi:hypothetical protein Tco_1159025 [Tanacetum coccineum]